MGILGLSKLLRDKCPDCVHETEPRHLFGRRLAIDASMSVYQFLIAMKGFAEGRSVELTGADGEVTSHLSGLLARTVRMIKEGIKPIYVFDGAPPDLKRAELQTRKARAADAAVALEAAKEGGDDDAMERFDKRTVRLTSEQVAECKRLLQLMGIPIVQAAGEAEAQCVELVRGGKAWAVATEDMDALTFGSPVLIRHLGFGDPKKRPLEQIEMGEVLQRTAMTMDQFVDLCILLGCDYVPKVHGIGPQKAWEGIQAHKSIEAFLSTLDRAKHPVPEGFDFVAARRLFFKPDVVPAAEVAIEFQPPDEEGLLQFLVVEKLFNKERVLGAIQTLRAALATKTQGRLDQFFVVKKNIGAVRPRESDAKVAMPAGKLRKTEGTHKKAVRKE